MDEITLARWFEGDEQRSARWRSEARAAVPERIVIADDTLTADEAWRLAGEGTGILWRGDFHNARQLVQALGRRVDRKPKARAVTAPAGGAGEAFARHREAQAKRARLLGSVLVPLDADYGIPLRRAPDMKLACAEAWGPAGEGDGPSLISLRELLGVVGAHEWRKKGVEFPILGNAPNNRIHPWYGVFSPVRGEYVQLVGKAKFPPALAEESLAFDIGTGTGVLAALLARRGIKRVIATDMDERALGCAGENIARLGVGKRVQVVRADLFPEGRAPLVVCNPPWVPARANSPIEHAIYDEDSRMLRGFLAGLAAHLSPGGEGWLILSDLAEHLGLRTRAELEGWIDAAGLQVLDRTDVKPQHPKAADESDPLHAARAKEVTSLWRLGVR